MVGQPETASSPAAQQVAAGTWSIPLPIPGPLGFVNVYALEVAGGLLLVDAGWDGDEQYEVINRGLGAAGGALSDVVGIVVTHAHGDHYSLAVRIREASDCWIGLHPDDVAFLEGMAASAGSDDHPIERWGRRWGALPEERAAAIATMDRAFSDGFTLAPDVLLEHGVELNVGGRRLEIVHTPGHTPGHVCVVEPAARLAFVGDHVLDRGRPNVSIGPGSAEDPLGDHIGALDLMVPYDGFDAHPGHGPSFELGPRLTGTLDEHDAHLEATRAVVARDGATVRDVANALPGDRDFASLGAAGKFLMLGETHAYLAALARSRAIVQVGDWPLRWTPST